MSFEGFAKNKGDDWDSNFKNSPSSKTGELAQVGVNATSVNLQPEGDVNDQQTTPLSGS
jgi:hypothetical protein